MNAQTPEAEGNRRLRIATYNVEWFNSLFDRSDKLIENATWSARYNVTKIEQIEALATVFRNIDADAVLVVEAPDHSPHRSTVAALEHFAERSGLRTSEALIGFSNDTKQELALLYDPDRLSARHLPSSAGAPRFDQTFQLDVDVDAYPDPITWSKPPLEMALTTASGSEFSLIGVHAKSKAPHGAESANDAKRISIANRRKQLAQCIWLRRRVEARLADGEPMIVLGDFNDGPGLDEYEKLFGRSGVEIVLGEDHEAELFDPHAEQALRGRFGCGPTSARFYNSRTKRYLSALLDYIMVSRDLRSRAQGWRIWHPFDDPQCFADIEMQAALLAASDHFPVTLDIDI